MNVKRFSILLQSEWKPASGTDSGFFENPNKKFQNPKYFLFFALFCSVIVLYTISM